MEGGGGWNGRVARLLLPLTPVNNRKEKTMSNENRLLSLTGR